MSGIHTGKLEGIGNGVWVRCSFWLAVAIALLALNGAGWAQPSASITAPASGTTLTGPAVGVVLSVAASDADGTVMKVAFFDGTNWLGSIANPPFNLVLGKAASPLSVSLARLGWESAQLFKVQRHARLGIPSEQLRPTGHLKLQFLSGDTGGLVKSLNCRKVSVLDCGFEPTAKLPVRVW